jgi:pyridoxal phosphate enzyme (YggS family)
VTTPEPDPARRAAELASSLAGVRTRIADVCAEHGRSPQSVALIAVTKGFPATDLVTLLRLGVQDIGENRDQEARAKLADLNRLQADADPGGARDAARAPRLHFVGQLQTNKARYVARYADSVHSVDRSDLVTALARAAGNADRQLDVFLQISLDGDPDRGGIVLSGTSSAGIAEPGPAAVGPMLALAGQVAQCPALRLVGVMAVAPVAMDPGLAFAALARISDALRAEHPTAAGISAGMSADYPAALAHGATHLRVGSALLGRRSPVLG